MENKKKVFEGKTNQHLGDEDIGIGIEEGDDLDVILSSAIPSKDFRNKLQFLFLLSKGVYGDLKDTKKYQQMFEHTLKVYFDDRSKDIHNLYDELYKSGKIKI